MPHDIRYQHTNGARLNCQKIIEVARNVGHRGVTHSNICIFERWDFAREDGLLDPCGRPHLIRQRKKSPIVCDYALCGDIRKADR
jgi:hypothetical protein